MRFQHFLGRLTFTRFKLIIELMPGWPKTDNLIKSLNNQKPEIIKGLNPAASNKPAVQPRQKFLQGQQKLAPQSQQQVKSIKPATPQTAPPSPTSTYKDDVNHVIEGDGKIPKNKRAFLKKATLVVVFVLLALATTAGGYYAYNFLFNPLALLGQSLKQIENADSFSAYTTFAHQENIGNVSAMIDYHKAPLNFSRGQLNITNINNEVGHKLLLMFLINSYDTYVQASYSEIDIVENQLRLLSPEMLSLRTYQLIQPALKGQKWVHFKIPQEEFQPESGGIEISPEKERELNEKFINTIIVRSHEKNFIEDGKKYRKIVLGFDKEKLVEFIEAFKALDLEVNLKDINSLIKVVKSVENWNEDLVTILLEKNTNNLHSLSVYLPKIPENALETSLEESVKENDSIFAYSELILEKLNNIIPDSQETNLIFLGKVIFSNYNKAPRGKRPSQIVESEEISSAIEGDLPYLMQMFFAQPQVPDLENNIYYPELFDNIPSDVLSKSDENELP